MHQLTMEKKDHVVKSLDGLKTALGSTTSQLNTASNSNDDKKVKKAQKSLRALAENIGNFGTKIWIYRFNCHGCN